VIEALQRLEERCEVADLAVGDYIIGRDIYVERKTSADFVNSLTGGRLFRQLSRLAGCGRRRLLIIEGLPPAFYPGASAAAVRGTLVAVTVSWGIPVLFSECPEETAGILARIRKQTLKRSRERTRKTYWGRKARVTSTGKRKILESMPMIGPHLAGSLLERFGSLEKIFTAAAGELAEVKGIGKTRSGKIREMLKEEGAKYNFLPKAENCP